MLRQAREGFGMVQEYRRYVSRQRSADTYRRRGDLSRLGQEHVRAGVASK
jgi:hypothetical protein